MIVLMRVICIVLLVVECIYASQQTTLAQDALAEILTRGAPILGNDTGCSSEAVCDWQARLPDSTKLVHMNLPGTHDSSTWNYTAATQTSLFSYTGTDIPPADWFQCQEHSMFQMLNRGIRVFDFRVSYNPGNDTLGLFHSDALLAPATRLEDVLYGFYSWLDQHPSEAVLISINYESGPGRVDDANFQQKLYNILNSDVAKKYWVQTNGTLGTLGEARGKLTLLQRFSYNLLPNTLSDSKRIGISLPASAWTDNSPNITIVYNSVLNDIAYIEDFYEPDAANSTEQSIIWNYNATTAHLEMAGTAYPDQLFISFASAENTPATIPVTPRIMALGNGTDLPGVNQRLLPWLQQRKGQRFGIIMLDFFDSVPGMVEAVIGL